jgi:hypothetical protein
VAELLSIRQPETDCGERGFGVVCVHVDDGHVEPLREVARVPRRPALHGIRREPDLVVGDHVQRPARRVAVEAVQVEGLGYDPLPCKRGIAVDENGQRDRGIVDSRTGRAIRLLGSGESLDNRVDGLEMARVGCHGDLDLTGRRLSRLRRREVVLDVSRPSLRIGDQRVDRALAFELPQDRGVRPPDNVCQDVQATTVGSPDEDFVRAALRRQLDGLAEHGDEHVQALDRELLLTDEGATKVGLECLDLRESPEQAAALVGWKLGPEAARFDRLAQPDPLSVVGDVLDLVRDRPRVDLAQARQRVEQGLTGHREPEEASGDARLQLRGQRRDEACLVERRVPHRLRAQRVETRVQVAVHPVCLHERHRSSNPGEKLLVGRRRRHLGLRGRREDDRLFRALGWDLHGDGAVSGTRTPRPHEPLKPRKR